MNLSRYNFLIIFCIFFRHENVQRISQNAGAVQNIIVMPVSTSHQLLLVNIYIQQITIYLCYFLQMPQIQISYAMPMCYSTSLPQLSYLDNCRDSDTSYRRSKKNNNRKWIFLYKIVPSLTFYFFCIYLFNCN